MKSYQDAVKNRYDQPDHPYSSIYSRLHPVGFYGNFRRDQAMARVLNYLPRSPGGLDLTTCRILDVGCGRGGFLNWLLDITGQPENVTGVDLSIGSIKAARKLNPAISYHVADITELPEFEPFDLVFANLVFSHLGTEQQVISALGGIARNLAPGGYFVWYELWARDHFRPPASAEAWGYHPGQMLRFAGQSGFSHRLTVNMFRFAFGRYHSAYFPKKIPFWLIPLLERLLPGPPGNHILVFQK